MAPKMAHAPTLASASELERCAKKLMRYGTKYPNQVRAKMISPIRVEQLARRTNVKLPQAIKHHARYGRLSRYALIKE